MKTPDKEALNQLYWTEQRPLKEIAEMFNVTIPAIRQKMDRLGISRRSNSNAQMLSKNTHTIDKALIERLYYAEDLSQQEVGKRLGLTQSAIKDRMKRLNIPSRGKARMGSHNGMHGRTHTPEAIEKIRAANKRQFSSDEARQRHAELTADQIATGRTGKTHNLLEQKFAAILDRMGIAYQQQYRLSRYSYDFYFPAINALVEVHGTFWHADPRRYRADNLSAIQHRNIANDRRKLDCAIEHGYQLLIFWESDIDRIEL